MLVNCVVYQEGKKLADIAKSEVHAYLAKPGCFVWVALRDPTDDELKEMSEQFNLHELAVEDAHHGHQRPKIEEYGSELFTVLHVVEPYGEELHVGEVSIFTGANYVLSTNFAKAGDPLFKPAGSSKARSSLIAPGKSNDPLISDPIICRRLGRSMLDEWLVNSNSNRKTF